MTPSQKPQDGGAAVRYEPHCDCLGGHVSMCPDPNGRWCRANEGWHVKPLEWMKVSRFRWSAGAYSIWNDGEGYEVDFGGVNISFTGHNSCPDPLGTAKRDADAHHAAYIRAYITTEADHA